MKKKIFCTLGPASLNPKFLKFTNKKIDLLRLNMSHVKLNSLDRLIKKIKKITKVPICIDTEGAQIRTKVLISKRIRLGQKFNIYKDNGNFRVYPKEVFSKLKLNDKILIGFDNLSGKIIKIQNYKITLKCLSSGLLETNKGVHIQNRRIKINFLTDKDFKAIEIAKKNKIKNFALSFTNNCEDIKKFNSLLPNKIKYFKIETREALRNFKKMTKITNFFLIDRGDLSREVEISKIPIAQRFIFKNKNKKNQIAIATNFLESMIINPSPTRAEANDIYNSLEMGASALVLAAETAIGKYPIRCINFLLSIIKNFNNNKI
jgi:pyruvate kinase